MYLQIVKLENSRILMKCFHEDNQSIECEHTGGHCIPPTRFYKTQLIDFLKKFC